MKNELDKLKNENKGLENKNIKLQKLKNEKNEKENK